MAATNEKLSNSEIRYNYLIGSIPEVIGELNLDGTISFVSPQVYDLLGYHPDEMIGTNFITFIHPDDVPGIKKIMKKAVKLKEVSLPSLRLKHKKGTYILVFAKGKLIKLNDKARLIGFIREITKFNETEKKLKESQDIFKQLNEVFLKFKEDPIFNLQLLINAAGLLLKADCAFFNILKRVNGKEVLESLVTYNEPPNFTRESDAKGHICTEIIKDNPDDVVIISDLDKTNYVKTDENVRKYNLKQFVSYVVRINNKPTATFCVIYTENRDMSNNDIIILQILSKSASTELARWNSRIDSQKSEEKYLRLINNLTDITLELDIKGIVTYVSPQCYNIMGYQPAEIIGKNVLGFIHPDDIMFIAEAMKQAIKTNAILTLRSYRIIHKNGDSIYASANGRYVNIGGNEKFIGVIRDERERKKFETELKESEEKYRNIVESIPIGMHMYQLDANNNLVFIGANPSADKILSVNNKMFIGKTIEEAFPPLANTEIPEKYRQVAKEGKIWSTESITYKDELIQGAYELTAFQISPTKIVASFYDITDRKKTGQKLKESEEKYRSLFENSPIALMDQDFSEMKKYIDYLKALGIKDFKKYFDDNHDELLKIMIKTKIVDVNKKTLEVYKAKSKEDFFSRVNQLKENMDNTMTEEAFLYNEMEILSLINGETTYDLEIETQTFKGDTMHLYAKTAIVSGFENTWSKVIVSIVNITERKETEQKLKESEEKYRTLFNSSPIGIGLSTIDGRIIEMNKSMERITGYPVDEHPNINVKNTYVDLNQSDSIRTLRKEQGNVRDYEVKLKRKNGTEYFALLNIDLIELGGEDILITNIRDITQIKTSEKKLMESEERYRSLVENAQEGIWALDENENTIFVNPRICEMLGYTKNEMMGKNLHLLIPDSMKERIKGNRMRREKGIKETYDLELLKKDGTIIYTKINAAPITSESRDYKGSFAYITDITTQKHAEDTLRESEELFRTLFEIAPASIIVSDLESNITLFNQKFCNLHGITQPELLKGRKIQEFIAERDKPKIKEAIIKTFRGELRGPIQYTMHKEDGTEFLTEGISSVLKDKKGKNIGLIGVAQDITERVRSEQKLKESEEKYKSLFDQSPMAILLVNFEGKIEDCNNATEVLFGYTKEELLGIDYLKLDNFPLDTKLKIAKSFSNFIKTGVPERSEIQMYRKDGKMIWISSYPISVKIAEISYILAVIQNVTDRVLAEQELKENEESLKQMNIELEKRVEERTIGLIKSERKFKSIFMDSPIGIELYDSNGNLNDANKACCDMFGVSNSSEIEGFDLFSDPNIPKDEMEKLKNGKIIRYEAKFDFDKVKQFNLYNTSKSGKSYLDVMITPLYIEDKQDISNYLVQVQDTTERQNLEAARKLNEIKLKEYAEKLEFMVEERTHSLKAAMEKADLYLNLVEVIIVALDKDGKITMLNKKGYSLLEYEEGKLVGKDWFEMCLPEQNRKDVSEVFKKLMLNEIDSTEFYENPILTKSGDEKIIAWRNTLLFDNKGEIIGTLGAGVDITERRKTQKKLKESEKKYRALFENTPIGVTISDYEGHVIEINEYMKKLLGYELEEFQKLGVAVAYANDQDRIPFKNRLEEQGYIQDFEVDLKKKDGKSFPALLNSIKTNITGGPIYINTVRDITEKKEIEEIKKHLLTRFSHEFKTPLISIKGFSDLLLSEYKNKLDEKLIGFLEKIRDGGERLKLLINAFMQSSQLGEKLTILNIDKENLSDLINLGVSEMEGLIHLRKHTIFMDIPEKLIGEFDKKKIYTVITNLLMNAIKYTPPEGKIFIHSKIEEEDIFFSIKDSGIGLTEEDKRHLFKPFGKIERYGKGWDVVSEGMGVGLHLSKEIISLHGGKIWAESEGKNKGSTFYFSLPMTNN